MFENRLSRSHSRNSASAFTLKETLIVLAILLVLTAIAIPIYSAMQKRAHKQLALERLRALGGALKTYASQNAGALPLEDAAGTDDWDRIASPEAKDVWYNALPRLLNRKGAGEFSAADFYTQDNLLFLPGANYPDQKKFNAPQFAIAFNTKLQRNSPGGEKQRTTMDQITTPARTVALLEQGCLNEDKTLAVQTKKDYDGSPKGSAKSFVGRYGGMGVLLFMDGHAELVSVRDTLTETGDFPYPQTKVIWTARAEDNPNNVDTPETGKKSKKKKARETE